MSEGRIQKALSGFYYVNTGTEVLTCRARGKFRKDGLSPLVGDRVEVTIENDTRVLYRNVMTYAHSFAEVRVGEPLVYINSLDCMAVAINQGSFARAYNIGTGNSWKISISPVRG